LAIEVRFGIFKDPVSASTHFAAFLAALVGFVVLVTAAAPDSAKTTAMAIYGVGLVSVFFASSTYHFFDFGVRGNRWLRRLDHAAIFLMIAGSYVPPVMHFLDGAWRIAMLSVIGVLSVVGIALKTLYIDCPRWLGTAIYLALGWLVVVPAHLILPQLGGVEFMWLAVGGAAYSIGAIVYATERPDPWPRWFGHHEVWHVFVMVGAFAHFMLMWRLLEVPVPPFAA